MTLEDELGCEGFWGFGGGYLLEKQRQATGGPHGEDRQLYCSSLCPQRELCWFRHKGRVMWLVPLVTATFAALYHDADNPLTGPPLLEAWRHYSDQPDPFTQVAAGNIEDGIAVAQSGRPKDRGPVTLPWPLRRAAALP